jgi:hypothetical protein
MYAPDGHQYVLDQVMPTCPSAVKRVYGTESRGSRINDHPGKKSELVNNITPIKTREQSLQAITDTVDDVIDKLNSVPTGTKTAV